jgi:DNA-binding NarL/FixJ family response regulator
VAAKRKQTIKKPRGPITVVIADQKQRQRSKCQEILGIEDGISVVGHAKSRHEVIEALKGKPRVLLLDFKMSIVSPDSLVPAIRKRSPKTRIVLMTDRASESKILEVLSQGARGYLWKDLVQVHLPRTVRVVDAGEAWIPRMMVAMLLDRLTRLSSPKDGAPKP